MTDYTRLAVLASATPTAREAEAILREQIDFVPLDDAEAVIVLGGDGHMLQVLHRLHEDRRVIPAYGMKRGTIGFLMNGWQPGELLYRLARADEVAKAIAFLLSEDASFITAAALPLDGGLTSW